MGNKKDNDEKKPIISEVIVVEGRDDTAQVKLAVDALTIETHGFGIARKTWELIEKAYNEKGIIILTDPDFSGKEIRRKLTEKFPDAKQAFLDRTLATRNGDVGIENADPVEIRKALEMAHCTLKEEKQDAFTEEDMFVARLAGDPEAKTRRQKLGTALGIGYGNAKTMLNKLNSFDIKKEDFYEALRTIDN